MTKNTNRKRKKKPSWRQRYIAEHERAENHEWSVGALEKTLAAEREKSAPLHKMLQEREQNLRTLARAWLILKAYARVFPEDNLGDVTRERG